MQYIIITCIMIQGPAQLLEALPNGGLLRGEPIIYML